MTIKYEEIEELSAVVAPVIAALALKAVTATKEATDTFTGAELEELFSTEADRIFEGYKAALGGDEDAVEAPETPSFEAFLASLGEIVQSVEEGEDPLDLSIR